MAAALDALSEILTTSVVAHAKNQIQNSNKHEDWATKFCSHLQKNVIFLKCFLITKEEKNLTFGHLRLLDKDIKH